MDNKSELMFGIWNNRGRDNDRNRDRDRDSDQCRAKGLFRSPCFSESETSEDVFNF